MPASTPLQAVFELLIAAVPVELAHQVLKSAIVTLLEDPAVVQPAAVRRCNASMSPTEPSISATAWAELRPQLRALVDRGEVTLEAIAIAINLSPTTLSRALAPAHRGPGRAAVARLAAWLAEHDADEISLGAGNSVDDDAPVSDRLSQTQRDRLAFVAEHSFAEIRRATHVSRDELDLAIAGEIVDPAVVTRLADFLAA
jgi:hypothetical protein